jgi:glycerol-3-phosphate dehydrogenase (NAD(P)+)
MEALVEQHENKRYLPGFPFPPTLSPSNDLATTLQSCSLVIMAVPSHGFREIFTRVALLLKAGTQVISAVKGIEKLSLKTMTQLMAEVLEGCEDGREIQTGVLSGPSFALEVAQKKPTAVTIGFQDLSQAKRVQHIFGTDFFRVYASTDVVGLELAAALKNIIAIATGICDGLGYGLNARAALITRGLAEIQRLGLVLGASPGTFSGLSGMGDLLLTCTGDLSRNRTVGLKISQLKSLPEIAQEMKMVAEGVKTTESGYQLAQKHGVEMPIIEQMYAILYQEKKCTDAVRDLLLRDFKVE